MVGSASVTVAAVAALVTTLVVVAMVLVAAAVLDKPTLVVGLRDDAVNGAGFVEEHAAVSNNAAKAKRCARERGMTMATAYVPDRSVGPSGVGGFVSSVAVVVDGFGGKGLLTEDDVGRLFGQHHHGRIDVAVGDVRHA